MCSVAGRNETFLTLALRNPVLELKLDRIFWYKNSSDTILKISAAS